MTFAPQAVEQAVKRKRSAARARVALPAKLDTLTSTVPAILRNLSETGAMLEVSSALMIGADAVLSCGELDCFGTIVWVRSHWCGFAFDEPLPQSAVIRARTASDNGQAVSNHQKDVEDAAKQWAVGGHRR